MVDSLQHYAHLSAYYFALGQGHPNAQKTWDEMLFYLLGRIPDTSVRSKILDFYTEPR
jgi:hypothetical protein